MFQLWSSTFRTLIDPNCCTGGRKEKKAFENGKSYQKDRASLNKQQGGSGGVISPGEFLAKDGTNSPPGVNHSNQLANHSLSYGSDDKCQIFQNDPLPIIQNLSINEGFYQDTDQNNINQGEFYQINFQNNPAPPQFAQLNEEKLVHHEQIVVPPLSQITYKQFLKSKNPHESSSQTDSKGSTKGKRAMKMWTPQEDRLLISLHTQFGGHWNDIVKRIPGRNFSQCTQRWRRIRPQKQRKPWKKQEDQYVVRMVLVQKKPWGEIANRLEGRTGKQVRERFINKLDPRINSGKWTMEEDLKIIELYSKIGRKWSEISKFLVGRPENHIQNRFYSHIQKVYKLPDSAEAVKNMGKTEFFTSYSESEAADSETGSKRGDYFSDKEDFMKIEENQIVINEHSPRYYPNYQVESIQNETRKQLSPRIEESSAISPGAIKSTNANSNYNYNYPQNGPAYKDDFQIYRESGGYVYPQEGQLKNTQSSPNLNIGSMNGQQVNNSNHIQQQFVENQSYQPPPFNNAEVMDLLPKSQSFDQFGRPTDSQNNYMMNGYQPPLVKRSTISYSANQYPSEFHQNQQNNQFNSRQTYQGLNPTARPDELSNYSEKSGSVHSQQYYNLHQMEGDQKLDHLKQTHEALLSQLISVQNQMINMNMRNSVREKSFVQMPVD